MTNTAVTDDLLGSCHFILPGEDTGHRVINLENDAFGLSKQVKSEVTGLLHGHGESGLGTEKTTNYCSMFREPTNSETALKLPLSSTSQPLQASPCSSLRAHKTQNRNHQKKQQDRKLQRRFRRRLSGGNAVFPGTEFEVAISEVQGRKKVEDEQRDDMIYSSVMPRPVNSRNLQQPPHLDNASVNGFPLSKRATMTLRPPKAPWGTATSEDLQSLGLAAPRGRASDGLPHKAGHREVAVEGDPLRSLTDRAGQHSADLSREYCRKISRKLSPVHQPLRQQPCQQEEQRKQQRQQQLRKQRPSRLIANFVFGASPSQELRHTWGRIDSPEASEEASGEARRLQQGLEEANGLSSTYSEGVHLQQTSTSPSTVLESILDQFGAHTKTGVAGPPMFAAELSSARKLNSRIRADVPVLFADEQPTSAPKSTNGLASRYHAEAPILPSAAAAPMPSLASDNGYLLRSKAPPDSVKSADGSASTTDQVDTFYFAATALGCSGLLCVAGFSLLLAIFRSYRLRQQKHEAAKQLIRRIHCSGALPTRELVFQYSREMHNQKHQNKRRWHHGPVQPCWKSPASIYFAAGPPAAVNVVLHPTHQQGKKALSDVSDSKAADAKERSAQTDTEGDNTEISQSVVFKSGEHCKKWYTSGMTPASNGVARSGQASDVLTTGGVADAARLSDHLKAKLPSKKHPVQENEESNTTHNTASDQEGHSSSGKLYNQNASSSIVDKRVKPAASCPTSGKESLNQADVQICRPATSNFSSGGESIVPPGPKWTGLDNLSKMTSLPLQAHVDKGEVRPQQLRQPQLEGDEQPQGVLKHKHYRLSQKVAPSLNGLPSYPPGQLSRAAPGHSTSVVHLSVSPSLPFPRQNRTTTKKEQKVLASGNQVVAHLSCKREKPGQQTAPFCVEMCTSPSRAPPHVLLSPHHDAEGKCRIPVVSYAACRLAHFLHLRSSTRTGGDNSGNSRRSGSATRSPTISTSQSEESSGHSLFGSGKLRRSTVSDYHSRSEPSHVISVRRSEKEPLPSCLDEERAISTPLDAGDIITWVSEVSNHIPCALSIKSSHSGGSFAGKPPAAAHNTVGDGGSLCCCTAALDWGEDTNTDIPTHMMTTAINKEEDDSSQTAGSADEDVTGSEDDAIVEFDSANISVAIDEGAHNQVTISENSR